MNIKLTALVFVSTLFFACSESKNEVRNKVYFDLPNYFKKEAQSLNDKKSGILKTLIKDGKKETLQSDSLDWHAELQPFIAVDLNKSAWIGKFEMDSAITNDSTKWVVYKCSEENIPIKMVYFEYLNSKINYIIIENQTNNIAFSKYAKLIYHFGHAIHIENELKIRFAGDVNFQMDSKIIQ